ncbi:gfo/Idh/MocA family oxidoreductase [Streptomyces armeniacus]|uniref:Gfo/Idh/MocA family oxidoreductase n=2 Tax=Streptomyces armeniacus TaxID=83291 RepID=A0A345Y1S1_9ACTN|nr:gfo/Idh/MocA family oxidoreductase [Streptomyces armeniacus]
MRRALPAMAASDAVELTAVAGRDAQRTREFADRFGCAADTYDGLLQRDDIDAVYVSVPTSLHVPWAERALRAGKHVLVEKPAGISAVEVGDLVRLAEERGLVLRENFMFLHHPQHEHVRGMVADGRLGTLRSFHGSFCIPPLREGDIRYDEALGGGALLDVGVYPLRAAQLILGERLTVAGATLRVRESDGLDLSGQATLASESGVLVTVDFGFEHTYGQSYTLWGSQARLSVDRAFTAPPTYQPVLVLEEQDHGERFTLPPSDQLAHGLAGFAAAVARAARTEGGAAADPAETAWRAAALETMELVDQVRKLAVRVTGDARVTGEG